MPFAKKLHISNLENEKELEAKIERVENDDDAQNGRQIQNGGEKSQDTPGVNLDQILIETGNFGKYQVRTLLLAILGVIFTSMAASEYVFTAARINNRCLIPECDSTEPSFTTPWLQYAVPQAGDTYESCRRFANISASVASECSAEWFDTNTIIPCENHVYEHSYTVVYDFDLGCDEWRRTFVGMMGTIGAVTALPLSGFISDMWGRRTAYVFTAINTAVIGSTRYFAKTYTGFMVSEYFEAFLGSGFTCAYILMLEFVAPKHRLATSATISSAFSLGQVVLAGLAYALPYWKHLTLAIYVPQFVCLAYYFILPESPRWYMSKGRYLDAEKILKYVAKFNGKELSDKSLEILRENAEEEKKNEKEKGNTKEPWLISLVFKHKPILIRCIVSPVWWISAVFIYYGMSVISVNLSGNMYVNYIAVSLVEIPGFWTAVLLMDRIGRKPVLVSGYFICTACQVGYMFMPEDLPAISLTLYLIGKYSIATVVSGLYVYTAELYPTQYRHRLFAFSSMMGRVGSIIAPLTPALGTIWVNLPFVMFGGFALLSGLLMFITPETLGTKLPDTMEQASFLERKKEMA